MSKLKKNVQPKLKKNFSLFLTLKNKINLLSASQFEIKSYIEEKLLENPFLEETSDYSFEQENFDSSKTNSLKDLADYLPQQISLEDHLRNQLSLIDIPENILRFVSFVISSLDENGFFKISHEEIASAFDFSYKDIKKAIHILKQLSPLGIGAQNHWQSLEWQAEVNFKDDLLLIDIIRILERSNTKFSFSNKEMIKELSFLLHVEEKVIQNSISKLRKLNLFPAFEFASQKSKYIYPDVIYKESQDQIKMIFKNYLYDSFQINKNLYKSLKETQGTTEEWMNLHKEAYQLKQGIYFRTNSIKKLASIILKKQASFFERGPNFIIPMSLAEVAKEMGLHLSTVSRICNQKYCETKWGSYSFKFFFLRRLKTFDNSLKSVEHLQMKILSIIACENEPLTDAMITKELVDQGFNIQRRTVSKYRQILHIPSSKKRK